PPGQGKNNALQNILSSWANKDPQRAASIITELSTGSVRDQSVGNAARQWALTDPRAALAWVQERTTGEAQRNAIRFALTSWVQSEPAAAAEYVRSLPAGKMQEEATSGLAMQLANSDIQTAVVWAQKLPAGAVRQNAISNIISQWSEADPQAAADFAMRTTEAEGRKGLLENISRQWARNDPQAALRWASSLPETNGREAALPAIVAVVAESDPREAARLVMQISSGEAQSSATAAIAAQWSNDDPRGASTWAASLAEGKSRSRAFESLMNRWAQNDPYAAGAWLTTLPAGESRAGLDRELLALERSEAAAAPATAMRSEADRCSDGAVSPFDARRKGKRAPAPRRSGVATAKREVERAAEVRRIIGILHKWGIHTLGQLAALEKEQVSLRLGPEAVQMWERANGKATRLLKLVQPPESFAEAYEFEHEIETSEPLLFMLRRFLQQLSLRLGALYLVAKELKLRVTFSDKNFYEHLFKIPEPSNNLEVLFRMLHTHLENFKSDLPIVAVSLEAEATKPSRQQFSLFETALRDPTQLSETLARLTGLLGADRVGTPVMEETHRPDAFRVEPFSWQLDEIKSKAEPRPSFALRRFRSAVPAAVLFEENQPAHLRSAEVQGEVLAKDGPYIASGNWWNEKAWARSEWDLQFATGALCRCHEEGKTWHVDGIYD
ncbi:MAG: hypothetical protein H0T83_01225, partial [Chthoniobacterales bacterium]|nr:hypothetical protein [Chthoniobacterales bacterium]